MTSSTSAVVLFATDSIRDLSANALTRKLRGFADLLPGWSLGEGLPVSRSAISVATELLAWASQLTLKADVFPGLDGECMVSFYGGDDAVRVIVYPEQPDSFGLRVERGHGPNFINVVEPSENVARGDVYKHVMNLLAGDEHAWIFRAYSTSNITTQLKVGSSSSFSKIRLAADLAALPSF